MQARHILVDTEDKAKDIVTKLASGGDFAALAKENSSDPGSKEDGGMLGYFSKGQMVPSFEEAAFALKKGEVSKPVQSQFGWHVIKLEDRRQKPPPAFADVKDRIIEYLAGAKLKAAADKLEKEAPTLAESERTRRQRELVEQDREFQRKRREFQEDLNQRKNEELAAVLERANKVIKQIFDQEKYDLILQDAVHWSPRVDITKKVIDALNAGK